jgi:RES domain-containing protein
VTAYRLSLVQYAESVDGEGARLSGGRWNRKNVPLVYASESRALAALELLVHISLAQLTAVHAFREFRLQKNARTESLSRNDLPADWREASAIPALAAIGTRWIESKKSLALRVPSVIVPEESNVLLNPLHRDFGSIEISRPAIFAFDKRLLGLRR